MSVFPNYIYRFKGIPKLFCGYQPTDSNVYMGEIYKIKKKNVYVERQKTQTSQHNTEEKEQCQRLTLSDLKIYYKVTVILARRNRSVEENRAQK